MSVIIRTYIAALCSGAALALCFPMPEYNLLAFVALTPFLVSLWDVPPWESFKAGMLMGLPYFFGTLYWIYHSISHYGGVHLAVSLLVVLLLALYLSLYTGLFGLAFSRVIRRGSMPALLAAPLLWVSLEFARSYALTGFPWASVGYSQYRFLHLIQFADITGVYGVSFVVVAVNGMLADIFIIRKRQERMPLFQMYPVVAGSAVLLLTLVAALVYGGQRLAESRPGAPLRVSIVQGNIEQDVKWNAAYQLHVLETYKNLTASSLKQNPDVIVWPESSLPFYFGHDTALTREFMRFQRSLRRDLLFGAITVRKRPGGYNLGNSALLLDASGRLAYVYDKIHLVPFGEYVPLKGLFFFLDKLVTGIGDYAPGEKYLRGKTPFGEFGTLICYEIIFPGLTRKFFREGGDFMVTITNDAWFGRTAGPYQHWSMVVLRAVENRKPVVRAANTGISGLIDSSGRILQSTPLFERTVLTGEITTDGSRTFYTKYGDLFSYLCIILSIVILINPRRT